MCKRALITWLICFAGQVTLFAGEKPRADIWGDPLPPGARARLGSVGWRHAGLVTALAFSPDKKTVAAGDSAGGIRLWEIAGGKEIRAFTGHETYITCLAFSGDGRLLASGSVDETARLWDVATGQESRRFTGFQDTVAAVAFSVDGRRLAWAGEDNLVHLYRLADGKKLHTLKAHSRGIRALAYSPDGMLLASAGKDQVLRLWKADNGLLWSTLPGHQGMVTSLAFSPDSKMLASAGDDLSVRLWDLSRDREVACRKGQVTSLVTFTSDGVFLVYAGPKGPALLWNWKTGKETRISGPEENYYALAISPDGKLLARGSDNHVARLWDLATGKEITPFPGHREPIQAIVFSPDGKLLVTASRDRTARLWNADTGKELHALAHSGPVHTAAFSPDGKRLATACETLNWWDLERKRTSHTFPLAGKYLPALSAEARFLAVAEVKGGASLWNLVTGKWHGLGGGGDFFNLDALAFFRFSPDGRLLAGAGHHSVTLWGIPSRKVHKILHTGSADSNQPLKAVAFSPDGRVLATAGEDSQILLWETASGRKIRPLKGIEGPTLALAFSPNLRLLASAGQDSIVHLWDTATGQHIHRFQGHLHEVRALAFSPDGARLASAGADFTALVWDSRGLGSNLSYPFKVTEENLPRFWGELKETNATRAEDVIWSLAGAPERTVPFLAKHLQPIPAVAPARLARLIADLDHSSYPRRRKAFHELEKLGEAVAGPLWAQLAKPASLEQRRRLSKLLEKIEKKLAGNKPLEPRVVRVLELIGTAEACKLLQALANGAPGAIRTEQARAALDRLEKRRPP